MHAGFMTRRRMAVHRQLLATIQGAMLLRVIHSTRACPSPEISYPVPRHHGLAPWRIPRHRFRTRRLSLRYSRFRSARQVLRLQLGRTRRPCGPSLGALQQARVRRTRDPCRECSHRRMTAPTTGPVLPVRTAPVLIGRCRRGDQASTRDPRASSW